MNENLNEEMQNQNTAEDVEKLVKVRIDKLKELQEIYEKGKIEQASKTYAVGPYTMELLLKKHNEDFYQVRFRYVSTSLYN